MGESARNRKKSGGMPRGGKRSGSGRPSKAALLDREKARQHEALQAQLLFARCSSRNSAPSDVVPVPPADVDSGIEPYAEPCAAANVPFPRVPTSVGMAGPSSAVPSPSAVASPCSANADNSAAASAYPPVTNSSTPTAIEASRACSNASPAVPSAAVGSSAAAVVMSSTGLLSQGTLSLLASNQFLKVDDVAGYQEPLHHDQTGSLFNERLRHNRKWCPKGSILEQQLRKLRDALRAPTPKQDAGYLYKQGIQSFRPEDPFVQLFKLDRARLRPYGLFLKEAFCFDPFAIDPRLRRCHVCKTGKLVSNGFTEARRAVGINDICLLLGKDILCASCSYRGSTFEASYMGSLPPHVVASFPFVIMDHKNAWTRELYNAVAELFGNGMSSEQVRGFVLHLHSLRFAEKKRMFESLVAFRYPEGNCPASIPLVGDWADPFRNAGFVPCTETFNRAFLHFVNAHQQYMDHSMEILPCTVASSDHTMKTVKMLSPAFGARTFNSLHKVTNEDGMIRSFTFQLGSGHNDEVEPVVTGICKSLLSYGYPRPIIWNTDRYHADRTMLERACPTLLRSVRQSAHITQNIPRGPLAHAITELPQLVALANDILDDASSFDDETQLVLSLDCEWDSDNTLQCDVLGISCEVGRSKGAYAIQIDRVFANEKRDVDGRYLVPVSVVEVFRSVNVLLVGKAIHGDLRRLGRTIGIDEDDCNGVIDLGHLCKQRRVKKRDASRAVVPASSSLDKLVYACTGLHVPNKSGPVRVSKAWSRHVLSDEQLEYLSYDLQAGHIVYNHAVALRDPDRRLNLQLCQALLESGQSNVDIMPRVAGSAAICRGQLLELCPKPAVSSWFSGPGPLTHARVLVVHVLVSNALLHTRTFHRDGISHALAPRSSTALSSFGDVPFDVVVPFSRLRDGWAEENDAQEPEPVPLQDASDPGDATPKRPEAADANDIDFVQLGCTLLQHCDAPELPDCQHDDKKTLEAFGRFVEFLYICDMGHAYSHRSPHESGVKQDIFHGMRRLEPAPLGHPLRKHWMFALSDAFSMYDADDYANVMSYLTDLHGGDDSAAMAEFLRRKHNPSDNFVAKHIRLLKPLPLDMFRRVLSVILTFGFMRTGSAPSQPLFSSDNWHEATSLLGDILEGIYSDHPDVNYYFEDGLDANGLMTYRTLRGENDVEASFHVDWKHLDSFSIGPERLEANTRWRYYRYNNTVKRNRGYIPDLRHHHSWIEDDIQLFTRISRGYVEYPDRVIPADFAPLGESFGIVPSPLVVETSAMVTACRKLSNIQLSPSYRFLASRLGTVLPFVNFSHADELKLLNYLVRTFPNLSADRLCRRWHDVDENGDFVYINGSTVLPKTTVFIEHRLKRMSKADSILADRRKYQTAIDNLRRSAMLDSMVRVAPAMIARQSAPRLLNAETVIQIPRVNDPEYVSIPRRARRCRGQREIRNGVEFACCRTDCPGTGGSQFCQTSPSELTPWRVRDRAPVESPIIDDMEVETRLLLVSDEPTVLPPGARQTIPSSPPHQVVRLARQLESEHEDRVVPAIQPSMPLQDPVAEDASGAVDANTSEAVVASIRPDAVVIAQESFLGAGYRGHLPSSQAIRRPTVQHAVTKRRRCEPTCANFMIIHGTYMVCGKAKCPGIRDRDKCPTSPADFVTRASIRRRKDSQ